MRKAARIIAIALMGMSGVLGLANAQGELQAGATALQQSVAFGTILHGVLGVLGAVGMIRRWPWSVTVAVAWGIAIMYTATVASFAFHDPGFSQPGTAMGAVAAWVSTALVSWFVFWGARQSAAQPGQPQVEPKG